jgi:hypothetical protein
LYLGLGAFVLWVANCLFSTIQPRPWAMSCSGLYS